MTPKDVANFPNRKIKRNIYSQIIELFDLKQEDGGILGMKDDAISSFCFDKGTCQKNYQINVNKFASEVEKWDEEGITFVGFIHSHITNDKEPSLTDLIYVRKFLSANQDIEQIDFPIVYSDNGKVAIQYYIFKQNQFIPIDILLVD